MGKHNVCSASVSSHSFVSTSERCRAVPGQRSSPGAVKPLGADMAYDVHVCACVTYSTWEFQSSCDSAVAEGQDLWEQVLRQSRLGAARASFGSSSLAGTLLLFPVAALELLKKCLVF